MKKMIAKVKKMVIKDITSEKTKDKAVPLIETDGTLYVRELDLKKKGEWWNELD